MPDSAGVLPPKRRFAVGKPSVRPSCRRARRAADRVAAAEQARGAREIAGRERGADARAGHALAVQQHRLDLVGGEAELAPSACSSAMSPARPLPKRNSGPTQTSRADRRCTSTMRDELLGRQRCSASRRSAAGRPGRRRARTGLRTWRAAAAGAAAAAAGAKNSRGSGSKLSATAGRPSSRARATRVAHQRLMPEMQAVEGADADHAAVRAQGPAFDVTEQPAHVNAGV